MFSLFKKKEANIKVTDVVFAKKQGKWHALAEAAKKSPETVFVAWFNDSQEALQLYFQQHNITTEVKSYRQLHHGMVNGKPVIFIEHHPLKAKEQQAFASLTGSSISAYSSLDDALFILFGGELISSMLEKVGLEENEPISHSMITKSIVNAQDKIAEKVILEQSADSMDEWVLKNLGGSSL